MIFLFSVAMHRNACALWDSDVLFCILHYFIDVLVLRIRRAASWNMRTAQHKSRVK